MGNIAEPNMYEQTTEFDSNARQILHCLECTI